MNWHSEVKVLATQSCPTLCNPMHCSPPGSSVHGILQARVPKEWVAVPFPRGVSQPRDWTPSPALQADCSSFEPRGKPSRTQWAWVWANSPGQGSLACCSSWGCRVRHNLATEQQHNHKALYFILLLWRIILTEILDEKPSLYSWVNSTWWNGVVLCLFSLLFTKYHWV